MWEISVETETTVTSAVPVFSSCPKAPVIPESTALIHASCTATESAAAVAAGAAAQAAYQAALVLATDGEADHPFALKFRLFEAGRLPLGITGNTFNLF